MLNLLKNTYLLDNKKIAADLARLWRRYQKILKNQNSSWEEMNEARAILYFIGYLYPEKIALKSMEERIKFVKPKISFDEFLTAVDGCDKKILKKYELNIKFLKLKDFYSAVKTIKNKVNLDGTYLDEKTFNKKYRSLKPKNYF